MITAHMKMHPLEYLLFGILATALLVVLYYGLLFSSAVMQAEAQSTYSTSTTD
jgi:hypothetical protein